MHITTEAIRAEFSAWDRDDDWLLDEEEFSGALTRLTGGDRPPEELLRLFRVADVDGDGLVSLPEFQGCVQSL
ncbi:EF-hand domain-containing protein [Streptomyces sp. NPDC012888]|uniref:EF-hand domain-containing protein n=1 Tax=Streptomyces sp. NPDC012888 TaxID=3364855 RepID=UPI0036B26F0E